MCSSFGGQRCQEYMKGRVLNCIILCVTAVCTCMVHDLCNNNIHTWWSGCNVHLKYGGATQASVVYSTPVQVASIAQCYVYITA